MVYWYDATNLSDVPLKNRIMMAPMCMYQASADGLVQPFHHTHYITRAIGGVGLVMLEATAVEARGRISMNDLGIWSNKHIKGLKKLVDGIHQAGAKVGIQLAHAGRKASITKGIPIAPMNIAFSEKSTVPKRMSKNDIKRVIDCFQEAATRAKEAGFDVIEIHAAHGYLINQFLSPLANKRVDEYGKTLHNRARFLIEVVDAIRLVWSGPLIVRVSADEYAEGGHHIEETKQVIQLIQHKIDAVNVSSGGVILWPIPKEKDYQIEFSNEIRKLGIKTIAGGRIDSMVDVENIIKNKAADMVYIGRLLLREPYFVLNAYQKEGFKEKIPKPYERGYL